MTNFDILADAYGGLTEGWVGKPIVLAAEKVTVKGQRTDSIKVRIPLQQQMAVAPNEDTEAPF